jgi:hypothetical protein
MAPVFDDVRASGARQSLPVRRRCSSAAPTGCDDAGLRQAIAAKRHMNSPSGKAANRLSVGMSSLPASSMASANGPGSVWMRGEMPEPGVPRSDLIFSRELINPSR